MSTFSSVDKSSDCTVLWKPRVAMVPGLIATGGTIVVTLATWGATSDRKVGIMTILVIQCC